MNEDDKTPKKEPWTPEWGFWIGVIIFAIIILGAMLNKDSEPESAPNYGDCDYRGCSYAPKAGTDRLVLREFLPS